MRLVALINSVAVSRRFVASMTIYERFTEKHMSGPENSAKQNEYTHFWGETKHMRGPSYELKLHARPDVYIFVACATAVW